MSTNGLLQQEVQQSYLTQSFKTKAISNVGYGNAAWIQYTPNECTNMKRNAMMIIIDQNMRPNPKSQKFKNCEL